MWIDTYGCRCRVTLQARRRRTQSEPCERVTVWDASSVPFLENGKVSGGEGLVHDDLPSRVFDVLDLPWSDTPATLRQFTRSRHLAFDHHLMNLPGGMPHAILHVRK